MSGTKKTLLISGVCLALIGGIAGGGAYAAQNGWRPPAWLAFWKSGPQSAKIDVGLFCNEHGVPEKFCTLCHAELKDKLLMCTEHGLPEAVCTLCHPENEVKYGLKSICQDHGLPGHLCPQCHPELAAGVAENNWCGEHGVPESLCTLCNPEVAKEVAMCEEHRLPKALCTICQPDLAQNFTVCDKHKLPVAFCPKDGQCAVSQASAEKVSLTDVCALPEGQCPDGECSKPTQKKPQQPIAKSLPRVKLAAADIADKAGIETAPVNFRSSAPTVTANCEVGYDETRLAHVRPRVAGIVYDVRVNVGDKVHKGDLLAVVDSAELGRAKAEYLAAKPMVELWDKNMQRLRGLDERGVVAGKSLLEAEAELGRANATLLKSRQQLRNLGLSTIAIENLAEEQESTRNLLEIVAPQTGTVIARHAVVGEAVEATANLFGIADLSSVWVHMDVYEKDLPRIAVGQPITFQVPGLAPRTFDGTVTWIASEVDDRTRTIRVRGKVSNTDGLLRANMFGSGEIQVGESSSSLVVPSAAVQWEGSSYVVFVQIEDDLYEPHRVLRGPKFGDAITLAWADIKPGDPVVTTGSFLLKTEIQKGSIGAGCCGE